MIRAISSELAKHDFPHENHLDFDAPTSYGDGEHSEVTTSRFQTSSVYISELDILRRMRSVG